MPEFTTMRPTVSLRLLLLASATILHVPAPSSAMESIADVTVERQITMAVTFPGSGLRTESRLIFSPQSSWDAHAAGETMIITIRGGALDVTFTTVAAHASAMSTILPRPASSQMVIHLMSGDRLVLHGVNALAAKNVGKVPAIAEVVQIPTLPLDAGDNLGRVAGRP